MDDLPRTLPLILLDESARRRVSYLAPPLSRYALRHPRLDADCPPPRLLTSDPPSKALPSARLSAFVRELPGQGKLLLGAWALWGGKELLWNALRIAASSGREIHVVFPEVFLNELAEDELADLSEMAASLVAVPDRPILEDQFAGCLEGMAVLLTSEQPSPRGVLSWRGSRHNSKVETCLEELLSGADNFCPSPLLIVASIEEKLTPGLRQELSRRDLGELPLVVGPRECAVRLGILRSALQNGDCHE